MKKSRRALLIGGMVLVGATSTASLASALTYQDGTDVQFTFDSTLSISLSDADIVIGNLIPGQDDTSNVVDVVVNTNNLYGYTLTATVGSATKNYRDLRHTNGTANFASIDVNSDLSTLSGQSSSVWGYTTSTNGTTWSNYNGLPKYDDTANTAELNVTDGAAADSTTSFKIGAFAAEGQLAGDYTNVINFKVIANSGQLNIQDITASTCPTTPTTVVDVRDGEEYTIQQLADGNCWMLDNLRLDLVNVSLDTLKGNTNASDTTLEYLKGIRTGSLSSDLYAKAGVVYWTGDVGIPNIYDNLRDGYRGHPVIKATHVNDYIAYDKFTNGHIGGKIGIMYNYCAASAGSFCFPEIADDNDDDFWPSSFKADEDICPAGWRLPDNEQTELINTYENLGDIMEGIYALRAILSGMVNSYINPDDPDEHYDYLIGIFGEWWTGNCNENDYAYCESFYVDGERYPNRMDMIEADTTEVAGAAAIRCVAK